MGVTQIGKRITQGLKPSARACAKAIKLWSEKAPERVSPPRVEAAWIAAVERTGMTDADLLAAVSAAVRRDPDFGRGKAMNLDRWLDEGRFMAWLGDDTVADAETAVATIAWTGPAEVVAAVAGAMGDAAVRSYLDPSCWDGEARRIGTRTGMAAERLTAGAGPALRAIGVSVEVARG